MSQFFAAVLVLGTCLTFPVFAQQAALRGSPVQVGSNAELEAQLDHSFANGELENLHGVVVQQDGNILFERYYPGQDQNWGTPLGEVVFTPDTLHDLRSITKSIVSLLYGIALNEQLVSPIDGSLLAAFPEYPRLAADPERQDIRISHVLTMTSGFDWNEDLPYTDPQNSEIAMERAADRIHYILSRDMVARPGALWNYSGGDTVLLAELIVRGTGGTLLDYAQEKLFQPLSITEYEWASGVDGKYSAASGLRLKPGDLAKIGQLVLDNGEWEGAQVIPAHWLRDSFERYVAVDKELSYGYQWWLGDSRQNGQEWMAGFGNGGQRLVIIPGLDLVVVITAGNYNRPEQWKLPVRIMAEYVLPSFGLTPH